VAPRAGRRGGAGARQLLRVRLSRALSQRAADDTALARRRTRAADPDLGNLVRCVSVRSGMPLPLAHALVGGRIAVAAWPGRTPAGLRRALVVGALLGVCPDADYLLGRLHVMGWGWHHAFTHSVAFAVIIGAIVSWALGLRGWRAALACVLPVL